METIYIKRQPNPCRIVEVGSSQLIVTHHEVILHNSKTYRIIVQATKRPYTSSYAQVELLTDEGWKVFVEPATLGIIFDDYANVLTNQYKEEKVRMATMDELVNIIKDYIKLF